MSPSLTLITIYASFCVAWAGFAYWIAPSILATLYGRQILSALDWAFTKNWAVETGSPQIFHHYLDSWNMLAGGMLVAAVLHLGIVLFIRATDRQLPLDTPRADSRVNIVLTVFSVTFLLFTVLSGVRGDYAMYLIEWTEILSGRDPWTPAIPYNAYGPLFNALAPLFWVTPLATKLLLAFAYVVYVTWLIKDFGARRGLVALSWPVILFWLINPVPWVQIAYFGHFDVLVASACVAAVHGRVQGRDGFAGSCLAIGILLKYLPVVILPFLAFDGRRFRLRLFAVCTAIVVSGLFISFLIWGASTFWPLMYAGERKAVSSLYDFLSRFPSWLSLLWDPPNVDWLEKPLALIAGLGVLMWCLLRQTGPALSAVLAVLVALLFYRVGYNHYQMVLFFLVSYWVVSEWDQMKRHSFLAAMLVGYFGLIAIVDMAILLGLEGYARYSLVTMLLKFVTGCALLLGLLQFASTESTVRTSRC